jgi:hypothetical protein
VSWGEARERIVQFFGHLHPCHAVVNHGFTIIGWLYGRDFGDRLCKAVSCGYDTDCTGATLGATLGILLGASGVPTEWSGPVGRSIALHGLTRAGGFDAAPATLDELADRVSALAELRAASGCAAVEFARTAEIPGDIRTRLFENDLALEAAARDVCCAVEDADGRELCLHYHGEPVLRPGLGKTMHASLDGATAGPDRLAVTAPAGVAVEWRCDGCFTVSAERVESDVHLTLRAADAGQELSGRFVLLAPTSAPGYPTMQNVPRCPKCGCRTETCVCRADGRGA